MLFRELNEGEMDVDTEIESNVEMGDTEDEYTEELRDPSFRETPEKASFNKLMLDVSSDWTPLKYQLRSNISSIMNRSRQQIVDKTKKAIDSVLEKIAPGQSSSLLEECFELQNKKNEESQLIGCINQALKEAPNRNVKTQLLSVMCGKGDDNQYIYKQNELVDMFDGISICDIKKARQHAAKVTPGTTVEPGVFSRKKLTDAQINHFLDFLQYGGIMQDVASGTRSVKLSTG